ncbi:MAG: DUF2279 domain-containing protein [Chitinophagaceae bacterium]|nr:DUF2279 domain-containing protein [Chitinophagaceae bacterium]
MVSISTMAQSFTADSQKVNNKRLWVAVGANALFWTGTYVALNKAWYSDYPKSSFHFFNDLPEWNQMDKAGHIWTTYQVGRASAELWKWAGLNNKTSAILGGASGLVYQSIIEIQDGFSSEWGFSWSDMGANLIGAGLFTLQEIGWKEQRIQVKMSYWPAEYPSDELIARRNELFGSSSLERILKDYNSQTYWLSANISSFLSKESKFPKWLNIAFGYGADGLLGGRSNVWENNEGITVDYSYIPRIREFYLSPDIDLTRIKTKSKALRTVFFILSAIKIPAPALEISGGKFSVKAIKF